MKKDTLGINALIKYIEFLLYHFDKGDKKMTLEELRKKFKDTFNYDGILLNQYFGIIRLVPLILINENIKKDDEKLKKLKPDDVKKINIIRNAVSHNLFLINEKGYSFKNHKKELKMTYLDFQKFLQKIEYDFHALDQKEKAPDRDKTP